MTVSDRQPCPNCGRTYGQCVGVADRCGVCLTGLSIDGRPIHPRQRPEGTWWCPCCDTEALELRDGTFMHRWDQASLDALGVAEETLIAEPPDEYNWTAIDEPY